MARWICSGASRKLGMLEKIQQRHGDVAAETNVDIAARETMSAVIVAVVAIQFAIATEAEPSRQRTGGLMGQYTNRGLRVRTASRWGRLTFQNVHRVVHGCSSSWRKVDSDSSEWRRLPVRARCLGGSSARCRNAWFAMQAHLRAPGGHRAGVIDVGAAEIAASVDAGQDPIGLQRQVMQADAHAIRWCAGDGESRPARTPPRRRRARR